MIIPDVFDAATFDSELRISMMNTTTNAELTLVLKVCLQQVAPGTVSDADNTVWNTAAWDQRVWREWTERYRRESERFWSGKYWLATPAENTDLHFPRPPAAATHRCNVWCRFRLSLVDRPALAHRTIQVANVVMPRGRRPTAATFRSHETLYDQYDLGYGVYTRGDGHGRTREYYQRTFVHEVGHALGLPHIAEMTGNAACTAADRNADSCYGTLHDERRDVMGFGEHRSLNDGRPWQNRIGRHFQPGPGQPLGPPRIFPLHQRRFYPVRL